MARSAVDGGHWVTPSARRIAGRCWIVVDVVCAPGAPTSSASFPHPPAPRPNRRWLVAAIPSSHYWTVAGAAAVRRSATPSPPHSALPTPTSSIVLHTPSSIIAVLLTDFENYSERGIHIDDRFLHAAASKLSSCLRLAAYYSNCYYRSTIMKPPILSGRH